MKGFDVKKIREEIDRKRSQSEVIGSGNSQISVPRTGDAFLRDLVTSLNTGNLTPAVKKMQIVEQIAEEKKPTGIKSNRGFSSENIHSLINSSPNENYQEQQQPIRTNSYDDGDREEYMARKMDEQNRGLVNKFQNPNGADVSQLVERYYGASKPNNQSVIAGNQQPMSNQLNSRIINEEIDRRFNLYLNENMGAILEGAIRNTIIEMYSKERVKTVLAELDFDGMIREGVLRTIKELQDRKKQKN